MRPFTVSAIFLALTVTSVAAEPISPPTPASPQHDAKCSYKLSLSEEELRAFALILSGDPVPQSLAQRFVLERSILVQDVNKQVQEQCKNIGGSPAEKANKSFPP